MAGGEEGEGREGDGRGKGVGRGKEEGEGERERAGGGNRTHQAPGGDSVVAKESTDHRASCLLRC